VPGNLGIAGPDELISAETSAKIMEITGMDHKTAAPERTKELQVSCEKMCCCFVVLLQP